MKILIISFPRSGTSLMYRIIGKHPEVEKMFFETNMLKRIGTRSENILNNCFPKGKIVCEKVIYEGKNAVKKVDGGITPVDYCEMWNDRFKKEARIIQIIRHPYDVWNSLIMKKYIPRNIKYRIPIMTEHYFDFAPTYFEIISKFENCFTVKYEDVILNSKVIIPKIYEHCGLRSDYFFKEHMKAKKVFLYEKSGLKIHDYRLNKQKDEFMEILSNRMDECLGILNQFSGPEYEV
jgi:hypothetical protein